MRHTARWCNGNTPAFGADVLGSNPSWATKFAEGEFDPEDSAKCDKKEHFAYLKDLGIVRRRI